MVHLYIPPPITLHFCAIFKISKMPQNISNFVNTAKYFKFRKCRKNQRINDLFVDLVNSRGLREVEILEPVESYSCTF